MASTTIPATQPAIDIKPEAMYDVEHDDKPNKLDGEGVSPYDTLKTFKRLYATGLAVSLGGMCAGYCLSVSGNITANPGFIQQFGTVYDSAGKLQLNAPHVSLWSGFYFVAQVVFQCISPFIVDSYGRRVGMYCFAGFMLAAIIAEILARDWTHWLAGRLLGGFSTAFLGSAVMTYMSEIAPTQIRGAMLSAFALSFALGQFFIAMGLQILFKTTPMAYRNCLYSQFVIFGLFAMVLLYIPESPTWLCRQGRHDAGKKALRRLVGPVPGYDVDYEYSVIQSELEESTALAASQGTSDWAAIFKWINFKRVIAAALPFTYQNFVGVPLVYGQTTYFFQMAGLPDPFLGKTTQSVVQLVGLVSSFYLVEKVGRRKLVLIAGGVLALFNFAIGGVGFAPNSSAVGSGLIALFCVWTFVYATSLAPIGWVGVVEVSSPRLRAKTAAIATVLQSLSGILFNYTVPLMLSPQYLGWRAKIGLFFGGITILFWIPCYFLFPETKDRTYAELDELYQSGVPVRKFASVKLGGEQGTGRIAA